MNRVLHNNEIVRTAPSVFAPRPWQAVSVKYAFVPTIEVVDMLRAEGFGVVRVAQSGTRIEGKAPFTQHMVRLRHQSYLAPGVRDEVPEIVLVNSHDGNCSYRFMAGIFRLVCSNGLIVRSADFGRLTVRHVGGEDFYKQVVRVSRQLAEQTPAIMGRIGRWRGIELTRPQQEAFAAAAMELRPSTSLEPGQLLTHRRVADDKPDLWTVTNRVQESLIRGGLHTRTASGRRTITRPIKSVDGDVRLNQALWTLAERMEALVAGRAA
ncbi:MAG: DUF945 domain-containing protein [Isosphaera sp.]|nr:DUF945 domain-containing protein [Isosphaera sp.]